jgi:hypothetical protein
MPQTITEKIIAAHAAEGAVSAGGIATVTPDVLMLNDVSGSQSPVRLPSISSRLWARIVRQRPIASCWWSAQPLDGEVAAILACGGLMARTRQILADRSVSQHEVRNG